jgi:hypothetical protein
LRPIPFPGKLYLFEKNDFCPSEKIHQKYPLPPFSKGGGGGILERIFRTDEKRTVPDGFRHRP